MSSSFRPEGTGCPSHCRGPSLGRSPGQPWSRLNLLPREELRRATHVRRLQFRHIKRWEGLGWISGGWGGRGEESPAAPRISGGFWEGTYISQVSNKTHQESSVVLATTLSTGNSGPAFRLFRTPSFLVRGSHLVMVVMHFPIALQSYLRCLG